LDLSHLNPSQRHAVETVHGPLLVLAGAGSGKTRVITTRVAYLLQRGVAPDRIVALSFTNKAAGEMRERLAHMVGPATATQLHLSTFHSLGVWLMRQDPQGFGLTSSRFSILDQGDVFGIVRSLLREHGHHGGSGERRYDVPAVVQRISLWKNAFVAPEDVESQIVDEYDVVAASIYPAYADRLQTLGAVDFDDLVCQIAMSLRTREDVRQRWQRRFDHVMVDEYQDTNDAQFELLRHMVGPPYNLAVVGDDDQAIYGWRGAKVENILQFDSLFPGTTVVKLEENYRCRAPILECANSVIANNSTRHDKTLIPVRGAGLPVTQVISADGVQEAAWIGKTIFRKVVEQGVSPNDIAVLYRSAIQAKAIEEELQQHGIDYRVLGGQSMYDKKEVKDALAYLKALVTPRDELAVRRALETPPRGIGAKTMQRLTSFAADNRCTLMEAVHRSADIEGIPFRAREGLGRFSALIRSAQARIRETQSASQALQSVIDSVSLRDHVLKETGSDAATEARMSGVQWLFGSIDRYEKKTLDKGAKPKWYEYFGTVALDGNSDKDRDKRADKDRPRGQVTLATMHSAKGLEWDYVFIIGVEEGTMPHRRVAAPRASDAIAGDLEEERRLFYVGITRAREKLYLSRGAARLDRGKEIPRPPSRFIEELPDSVEIYDVSKEEELSSDDIGSMADDFLAKIKPETESESASESESESCPASESESEPEPELESVHRSGPADAGTSGPEVSPFSGWTLPPTEAPPKPEPKDEPPPEPVGEPSPFAAYTLPQTESPKPATPAPSTPEPKPEAAETEPEKSPFAAMLEGLDLS
jgi:DNA helicase-2/ATP-dependent DNA helicase PcrA